MGNYLLANRWVLVGFPQVLVIIPLLFNSLIRDLESSVITVRDETGDSKKQTMEGQAWQSNWGP